MRFEELVEAAELSVLEISGSAQISHVTADSRAVTAGSCFIAVRGPQADGHDYIADAAGAGAAAIVCEDVSNIPGGPAWVRVPDTRRAAGPVAQALLGWPARKLTLLGVTGTKGKTTVSYLVRHILAYCGRPTGMIGTVCYDTGGRSVEASNTTPGSVQLASLMAEMVDAGLASTAMEVSSHALDQHRTAGLDFAAAAFTNLTGDHLDYHGTPERYLEAKSRLFTGLTGDATAVLNRNDPACKDIAAWTAAEPLWYGVEADADLSAGVRRIDASGSRFSLTWRGRTVEVSCGLVGRHNVSNCLAAAGMCLAVGAGLDDVAAALARPIAVPGRLQRVPSAAPFGVVVDYAHTDDALDNALAALRPMTDGKLIVLFGCGGDRDRTKRPRMARVAAARADRIVLTQDNPRTEDPQQILDDILAGFDETARGKLTVQPDRRAAIEEAIAAAEAADMVVLAGKGHETYQLIGTTKHHFDDAEVAAAALAERFGPVPAAGGVCE